MNTESFLTNKSDYIEILLEAVKEEIFNASTKYDDFHSLHEGFAVIQEEIDKLWGEIKKKRHNCECIKEEAIQVAAMAIKLIYSMYHGIKYV